MKYLVSNGYIMVVKKTAFVYFDIRKLFLEKMES